MKLKKLLAAILTVTLAGLSLTGIASAQTDPLSTTVPVFGTDLVITIVTDAEGGYQSATITAATSAADATVANGFVATSSSEHDGFEVNFTNSTTGVEIEVNVVDGAVTKTEVDTHSPGENGGPGVWTGDPLGNGDTVIISYDVTLGTDGVPVITVPAPTPGADTFFADLGSKTSTHEGETAVTHTIQIYNGGTIDPTTNEPIDGSQDSVNLVIRATVEHGQLEVEAAIVDPSSTKGHDDDESDDLKSDDLKSDDESHDSSPDDESDDESHDSSPDDESHSGSPEGDDD